MFQLREAFDPPIVRPRQVVGAAVCVGAVRVGAERAVEPGDAWVVIETTVSRDPATLESKQALRSGDKIRFTLQYGLRPKDDNSNLLVVYGTIIAPRSILTPDAYTVRFDAVRLTHDLDPSVSPPLAGQIFLVAPWSVAVVEPKAKPAEGPTGTTETFSGPPGGSDVADWKPWFGDVATTPVKLGELTGTAPMTTEPPKSDEKEPTGQSTMTYVGIGAIVALAALLFFVVR